MPWEHRPVLARRGVQPRPPLQMGTGSDRRQSAPLWCRAGADDRRLDRFWLWRAADEDVHAVELSIRQTGASLAKLRTTSRFAGRCLHATADVTSTRPKRPRSNAKQERPIMGNCIVVVQFDLPKRSEDQAIKGGTSTAPIYRDLGKKGLIRKDYLNG